MIEPCAFGKGTLFCIKGTSCTNPNHKTPPHMIGLCARCGTPVYLDQTAYGECPSCVTKLALTT